jgi:hypothetical protein
VCLLISFVGFHHVKELSHSRLKKIVTQCEEYGVDASYGGSKAARILVPKVHINGKINIKMKKKTLKTNV